MKTHHAHHWIKTIISILLIMASFIICNEGMSQTVTFDPPVDISTSANGAMSVAIGDIDGDGDPDVLSASLNNNTIAWYANDGAWPRTLITTTAIAATSVAVGDVDGDGDLDVLSASLNDNKIAWYANDGSGGTWTETAISTSANGARSVATGDIDRDGDLDVLSASWNDNKIAWYENDGAGGTWTETVITTSANGAVSVAVGDIDRDGDPDVLSASQNDDTIAWYENDGAGGTWTQTTVSTSADGARSVTVGDIDRDGDPDILSASQNDDTIAWYANGGNGSTWTENTITANADGAMSVAVWDMDHDGDPDVLSASINDNTIAWYENDGTGGTWTAATITASASNAVSVAVGDIDQDGDIDVFSASTDDNRIGLYRNTMPGFEREFGAQNTITTGVNGAYCVAVDDLDRDGDLDVIAVAYVGDNVTWYENDGSGGTWTPATVAGGLDQARFVTTGDIDRDGDPDVLTASSNDNIIYWYANDGAGGTWTRTTVTTAVVEPRMLAIGDIDRDGDPDILSASNRDDRIAWYENDGTGGTWTQTTISTSADGADVVLVGDIDRDGDLDVVSSSPGDDTIAWYENDGAGGTWTRTIISTAFNLLYNIALGDMDRDGDLDVLAADYADNAIYWYENDGAGGTWTQTTINTSVRFARFVETGDIDLDGTVDVLSGSFINDALYFFENNGAWTAGTITTSAVRPTYGAIGDIDRDGDPDVLSSSYLDNRIAWYPNYIQEGDLTAAPGVTEPVALPSTINAAGAAVDLLDFTLTDGGVDGLPMTVSELVFHTSGTGPFAQVTFRLNGPDAVDVTGTYDSVANTLTFSGLAISVADGAETYAINAYYNDNTGLTEHQTFILSIDGDPDVTTGMAGVSTTMKSTTPVDNGTGTIIDITATQMVFSSQPATPVDTYTNMGTVTLQARDDAGNLDPDFTETITLTDEDQGAETDAPGVLATTSNGGSLSVAAIAGQASWADLTYDADAVINIDAVSTSFNVESLDVSVLNTPPTLTGFADVADTTAEGVEIEITFADLAAQGDEDDADGAVNGFAVLGVLTGTLNIGATAGTAAPYAAGGNDTIDAVNNAYWTPAAGDNGITDAFAVVAEDDDGATSTGGVTVQVLVIGITVSPATGETTEAGDTATFTVRLNSQPAGNVVIDVISSDTGEGTVSPSSLTYTGTDWNIEQTVTVTGENDDMADGNQPYTIYLTADTVNTTDTTGYVALDPDDVAVVNTDDDTAGFTVGTASGNTTEAGGTATFTVRLISQPDGNVVVNLVSSDTGEGTVSSSVLTFTDLNWNADRTVTVTGANDDIADGDQTYTIQLAVDGGSTTDSTGYASLDPNDVTVINIDDETAGFTVSAASGNTTEAGGTAAFTVRLNSRPNGNVVINIDSSDTGEGTVFPSVLTFTDANWDAEQTVTATGVDDDMADGDQTHAVQLTVDAGSTADTTGYAALDPDDVTVVNIDDETAGFTVSAASADTTEDGGTATFTVRLNSRPAGNVIVDLASSDTGEGTIAITELIFTDANWDAEQTVTITGVDDPVADGNQSYEIRITVDTANTTDTTGYAALDPNDVALRNTDDETAGFIIGAISADTTEAGGTATFTVRPASRPEGVVVLNVVCLDDSEGTVFPASLSFGVSDWDADQTVTVAGVDDEIADGNQSYTIRLTVDTANTTDTTGYALLDPDDVIVINTDDESAGFTVGTISGNTGEDGTMATFTVRLNSAPDGDVVIDAISSDTSEGTVSTETLTFNADNWDTDQTVTVTGADDAMADGGLEYMIMLSVNVSGTSDTTGYAGLDPGDVAVINADDDSAGITVLAIGDTTDEDGTAATFTVRLDSQPDGDVAINVESADYLEGIAAPARLTFTSADWDIEQTVTVTGVDDPDADGDKAYTVALEINIAATTDTTGYKNMNPPDAHFLNRDNEDATSCSDGLQNGNETGTDCGGDCVPCQETPPAITGQRDIEIPEETAFQITLEDLEVSNMPSDWPSGYVASVEPGNNYSLPSVTADMHRTTALILADVDGDGDPDLIAGNDGGRNRLYLNNGTATPFAGVSGLDIGGDSNHTRALAFSDVNGDGTPDLITGNYGEPNFLYLNNGTDDPFGDEDGVPLGGDLWRTVSLSMGDVDSDGDPDLIVGNDGEPDELFLNEGGAGNPFGTGIPITPDNTASRTVVLGDVDGDGKPDLVVGGPNLLYLNSGTAEPFGATLEIDEDGDTAALALFDMNGDGLPDLVIGNRGGPNRLVLNNGSADPYSGPAVNITEDAHDTFAVTVSDVDRDGDPDIIVGNGEGQSDRIYFNNGTENPFDGATGIDLAPNTGETAAIVSGDIDGDRDFDLVIGTVGGENLMFLNNGSGNPFAGMGEPWTTVMPAADFSGSLTVPVAIVWSGGRTDVFDVRVTVTAVNDPPEITGQFPRSVSMDIPFAIDFADLIVSDPDNVYPDDFAMDLGPGDNYSLDGLTITPEGNFAGDLFIPVSVHDGSDWSRPWTMTVGVFADLDGDGMNDAWETGNGLDPTQNDDAGDLDGDTYSNVIESVCGTLPNDPESVPATPMADAGGDQVVETNDIVQLRGTNTNDPAGENSRFSWTQTGGTPGSFSNPEAAETTFIPAPTSQPGDTLTIALIVKNCVGESSEDTILIIISEADDSGQNTTGEDDCFIRGCMWKGFFRGKEPN